MRRRARGRRVLDRQLLAGLRVRPVEDGDDLLVVVRREAVELRVQAGVEVRLALGDLVGRDPRRREHLRQVGAGQLLERPRVGDLVHAAADEQVAGQRARRRVVDHLVDLQLVVARAGLEEEVVRQVLDQVARGEHVVAGPRVAAASPRQRALAAGDEVVRVTRSFSPSAASGRRPRRRGAGQHRVDRDGDQLDVAVLLGGDVRDQVVERPRALAPAEVERLERVVHQRRHLAEPAAHQLLHGLRALGVGIGRRGHLHAKAVDSQDHRNSSSLERIQTALPSRANPVPGASALGR